MERIAQINLDEAGHYLGDKILAEGSMRQLASKYRPVVSFALECAASSIVVVHNHPSGSAIPSEADKKATQNLIAVLRTVEIELADHVIVTRSEAFSMNMAGML